MKPVIAIALLSWVLLAGALAPQVLHAQDRHAAPEVVVLWPEGAPGAVGTTEADVPRLTAYLPAATAANGTAVVVLPGGGYRNLAVGHEGVDVARWLNALGIAAFVVEYRLAPRYRHPAPLQDARRALRHVRHHAARYGVRPDRIGVWGFSAGGHLAATLSTGPGDADPAAADPVDRVSARPDFAVLAYPVISFTEPYTHVGSREALLGDAAGPERAAALSSERRVTAQTPPTFLFHTTEDTAVPPENSIAYYLALREAGVSAEVHIYQQGRHGVGLAPDDPVLSTWPDRLADWLHVQELLPDRL